MTLLNGAFIIASVASVICLGVWLTSQTDEQNAHSLWVHSEPGVSAKNLTAYEKVRKERRLFGWMGIALGLLGLICAVFRFI